jgi:hypothetical protein
MCRGRSSQHLLDPGRDRLGDHLEVPQLHPARRQLGGRVLLGRAHQQPPAGRHRHQDDPPRAQHAQHASSPRASRPGAARTPTAAWSSIMPGARAARATSPSATRC